MILMVLIIFCLAVVLIGVSEEIKTPRCEIIKEQGDKQKFEEDISQNPDYSGFGLSEGDMVLSPAAEIEERIRMEGYSFTSDNADIIPDDEYEMFYADMVREQREYETELDEAV